MKKYKQFIVGLIVGAILFTSIPVIAEGITVLMNPFPIFFNGQQATVEAYNINGRTFLSLGDVAKYFDSTASFNETDKRIDVNSKTAVSPKSTIPRIEIDKTTGNPVGAEFVEYKNCKNAVKYNGLIYVQSDDLVSKLGIHFSSRINGYKSIYAKDNKEAIFDLQEQGSFIYVNNHIYYGAHVFKDLIGE